MNFTFGVSSRPERVLFLPDLEPDAEVAESEHRYLGHGFSVASKSTLEPQEQPQK